ncbi:MAG: LacI family DNA-binding transcriptional regulator [Eubacteriales bacterium]|nr:LacI family DNA-binding transcriptional regulator [Eubacteriales bacterium]
MRVTLKSIAEQAGVSINTVSLALRNMPNVKKETREEIFQIATELGYFNRSSRNEPQNICLISTGERLQDSYFYMNFYQKVLSVASQYHYTTIIYQISSCDIDPAELRHNFEMNSIGGAIILGDSEERIVKKILQCGIPVIGLSTRYFDAPVCSFVEDNLSGINLAVSHLKERGFTEIGFIGNPSHSTGFLDRYAGFIAAMHKNDLIIHDEYLLFDLNEGDEYVMTNLADQLAAMPKMPQAFVCANDNIAIIALKALVTIGLSVPDDVSLIGFDSSVMGKMVNPSITSIDVQCDQQTSACLKKLTEFIRTNSYSIECHRLPVKLVEGESVGYIASKQESA